MSKLWDENGEYIGWKQGKPWWQNHGQHEPIEVNSPEKPVVICKVCRVKLHNIDPEKVIKTNYICPVVGTAVDGEFYWGPDWSLFDSK